MSDQAQEQEKKKSSARPIGGIGQYATIGGAGKRSDVQPSGSPDVQTFSSSAIETSKGSGVRKSKHPDWKQQTVYLAPDLVKWLRVQAIEEEREISEIVSDALEHYRHVH